MPVEFCPICLKMYEPFQALGEERCPACWKWAVKKAVMNNPNDFTGVLVEDAANRIYAERTYAKRTNED